MKNKKSRHACLINSHEIANNTCRVPQIGSQAGQDILYVYRVYINIFFITDVLLGGGSPRRCARACVPVRTLAVLSILCLWPTFLCSAGLSSLYETDEISDDKRELHQPSAWINLGTTFLYMMNYYIMGPTSAEVRCSYDVVCGLFSLEVYCTRVDIHKA